MPWKPREASANLFEDFEDWMKEALEGKSVFERLPEAFRRRMMPALNLAETEKEFVVTVDLPGLEEKDVEVQILGNKLVISGERRWEDEKKEKEFYRVESEYGSFRRMIALPDGLTTDAANVAASFDKGMLEIRIPKTAPQPAAKIKIKTGK
jgi:HSP20 family protein